MPFLGYLITSQGIAPTPEKVNAILSVPQPQTAKQLRQYLGMINFYRSCMPSTAATQTLLNDMLKGNIKKKAPLQWSAEAVQAFEKSKQDLAQATLLVHPHANAALMLVCDASDFSVGAVLQQRIEEKWMPLGFFSKKLSSTEARYSAFDRELLAIYLSIKHFRHMLEARIFSVQTDHKPLIYAFRQKLEKTSPRQARHLDFIAQFTTDIRHIPGKDNVVADALSRIEEIENSIDYKELATSQKNDEELKALLNSESSLKLKLVQIPGTDAAVYCDTSTVRARPFITTELRKVAFASVHRLSHPGAKATIKLAIQRFIWPSINKDCREWVRACIHCQQSKVSRHVHAPVGNFVPPSARFEHVHIDINVMPPSEGKRYCLTCVDRFSRWPEVIPMHDQEAETVAQAFWEGWICRFGTPLRLTTDQGRQFESQLFKSLNQLAGTNHRRSTAYHPQANGLVERFHRQLKAAIRCHQHDQWTKVVQHVVMGIRASINEDIGASPYEMLVGQPMRLPGEFFEPSENTMNAAPFIKELRHHFDLLRPVPFRRHGTRDPFVFKDLSTATHVFIRHDAVKNALRMPYDGPYEVLKRGDKTFIVKVRGKDVTVSIDRLKPAYMLTETSPDDRELIIHHEIHPPTVIQQQQHTQIQPQASQNSQNEQPPAEPRRSGRRVRFVERYQAGFP